jgi:hypothetical protein
MDSGDEPLPMIKRGPFSMPIGGPFSTPIDRVSPDVSQSPINTERQQNAARDETREPATIRHTTAGLAAALRDSPPKTTGYRSNRAASRVALYWP